VFRRGGAGGELGLEAPFAAVDLGSDTDWGPAGLRVFGFYNFKTESPRLPALSIRGDVSFPTGPDFTSMSPGASGPRMNWRPPSRRVGGLQAGGGPNALPPERLVDRRNRGG
jgi:hypothetical protein